MRNLAKGSVLSALIALIGFLFYFQSKAEAVTIAIDSPESIKQEFIEKNNLNNQNFQQQEDKAKQQEIQTKESLFQNSEESLESSISSISALSDEMIFKATAYCLRGRTASGTGVRRGIVAADRRILPLGTKINLSAGAYSGTYTVADTGGAVKGKILDIWVPSCAEAIRFGRRTVKVKVLGRK
jgi:3D (Asp-Asp-Asp) domain-containing protein